MRKRTFPCALSELRGAAYGNTDMSKSLPTELELAAAKSARHTDGLRLTALILWYTTSILLIAALAGVAYASIAAPAVDIDHSVAALLEAQGVKQPAIIAHIDLTQPFETVSPWTLVIVRESVPPPHVEDLEHGPISVCIAGSRVPDCSARLYNQVDSQYSWFNTPYELLDSRVVYAGRNNRRPMLLIRVCGAPSGDGDCAIATALYGYDRRADRFYQAFLNVTGRNRNQATRFVESGPLRGHVIVDYPTENAPYSYWIEVYQPGTSEHYVRVLRYRGHTGYGDGNSLAVADSEMPEILRRLDLWRPGDALPVPPANSDNCAHPVMRKREEWCK
jgi:hypothetical protein